MKLAGRELSELSLDQLEASLAFMQSQEADRIEASKHPKFDNKTLAFPANNPAFEKLKIAIQVEIGKRK